MICRHICLVNVRNELRQVDIELSDALSTYLGSRIEALRFQSISLWNVYHLCILGGRINPLHRISPLVSCWRKSVRCAQQNSIDLMKQQEEGEVNHFERNLVVSYLFRKSTTAKEKGRKNSPFSIELLPVAEYYITKIKSKDRGESIFIVWNPKKVRMSYWGWNDTAFSRLPPYSIKDSSHSSLHTDEEKRAFNLSFEHFDGALRPISPSFLG